MSGVEAVRCPTEEVESRWSSALRNALGFGSVSATVLVLASTPRVTGFIYARFSRVSVVVSIYAWSIYC